MVKKSIHRIIDKFKGRFFKRCYKLKLLFISFKQDGFKVFSLIYFLITLFITFITITKNTFVLVDMSNFFLTIGGMLGAIFVLCVTIHFFYVQNFLNYSALIFISDVSNSKKNYTIFGIIGVLTIFFFLLGGDYNIFIYQCPDKFLLPLSIVLISFALWLIIYYFHNIQRKLSPRGIIDETEKYFRKNLQFVKKYNNLEKSYSNLLKMDIIKQNILKVGTNYYRVGWYKLESMCDNYLKLIGMNENTLAKDYLLCIENCFVNLIQSYGIVNTRMELKYFTNKTEIDNEINSFIERIKLIIYMNIKNNDISGMVKTFGLLSNIIVKTYYVNYSTLSGDINRNKVLYSNLIINWQQFFWEVLKYNNEEALFQRKEGVIKFISTILQESKLQYDMIFIIEGLLQYVNYLNIWVIKQGKQDIFNLHEIYGVVYLGIIDGKFTEKDGINIINKSLYHFLGDDKKNIDNFIKYLRTLLSINRDLFINNAKENIENMLHFIDNIHDVINILSKKNGLDLGNRLGLLIKELGINMYNLYAMEEINTDYIKKGLNQIIDIINIVINNKNNVFIENIMSERDIYDQICRIGIYAKKVNDVCLFEKCFDILQNRILHHKLDLYDLGEVKYFCYRLFIEDKKNYERYFSILYRFFELQLEKYGKKFEEYGKTEIVNFINKINGCYNIDRQFMDIQISEIMLKDEEGVKMENQEKITKLLLKYCINLLAPKKKNATKSKTLRNSKS